MRFSLKAVSILLVVSLFMASCASVKDVAKETALPVVEHKESSVSNPEPEVNEAQQPVEVSEPEETKQQEDVVEKQEVTVEEIYFGPRPVEKPEEKPVSVPLENASEKPAYTTAAVQENNTAATELKEEVNNQMQTVQTKPGQTTAAPEEPDVQNVSAQAKNPSAIMLFVVAGVLALGCVAGFISNAVKKRKNS